jgi:hypothetical protein
LGGRTIWVVAPDLFGRVLRMQATRPRSDPIPDLRSQAAVQRIADRVAAWFVPAVLLISLLAVAAWLIFGPIPRLPFAFNSAVAVNLSFPL